MELAPSVLIFTASLICKSERPDFLLWMSQDLARGDERRQIKWHNCTQREQPTECFALRWKDRSWSICKMELFFWILSLCHLIWYNLRPLPARMANFGRANQENGRRCYLEMETESSRDGRLRGLKMWACRHTNRVWRGRERSADVVHYPQGKVEIYGESLNVPVFAISLNREYLQACFA